MRLTINQLSKFLILFILISKSYEAESLSSEKKNAWRWIDQNTDILEATNKKIWSYAEIGLKEKKSSKELQELLKQNGFSVKAGIAGMPTAFTATFGSSGPRIGILAEFDALPGVSQSASPTQEPGPNPDAGHACGHSIFGVGSVAAAIALKQIISLGQVKGIITLYGTPAEETGIGKVYMLKAGYFRQDDVILNWHPSDKSAASFSNTKAIVNVKFQFRGSAAHASAMPWSGRSALDAVELMNTGANFMREHIKPDARIHYVITAGGDQPNVVPPEAEVWYYIRADKFTDVEFYFDWIKEIAQSAAKMSQTELINIEIQSEIHEMIPLESLAKINYENLKIVGPPKWNNEEIKFARETQSNFKNPLGDNISEIALSSNIEPLLNQAKLARASTDVGDISWFVPTGGLTVTAFGHGLPIHSWPVVASTGTSIGTKALVVAAKVLSATAIDLYSNPALLEKVKSDWIKSRGNSPFRTLIPENQKAPSSIN